MADCELIGLAAGACGDARWVGGLRQRVFLARRRDILSYTADVYGAITDIEFDTYKGFVEFYQSSIGSFGSQEKAGETNKFIRHTLTMKVAQHTQTATQAVDALIDHEDIVAVVETKNNTFKIYGKENGLSVETLTQSDGENDEGDTSYIIALQGAEHHLAVEVKVGGSYAATRDYLESLVVAE